jgi:hypothetical protein
MSPKAEIVTMDRAGLTGFIHELKRMRIRQQFPQLSDEKLDKGVEIWEQQHRDRVDEMRNHVEKERPGSIIDGVLRRELNNAKADLLAATFASVKFYLGKLNRDINDNRVYAYRDDMAAGKWWFTPDPIVVTTTGEIINGQHRLLAVEDALAKGEMSEAPQFVVVWNVDKKAAILMDEARRTSTDRRDIAVRFATAK